MPQIVVERIAEAARCLEVRHVGLSEHTSISVGHNVISVVTTAPITRRFEAELQRHLTEIPLRHGGREMEFTWRRFMWILTLALGISLVGTSVQGQTARGSIAGTIHDDTGGTLPGVTVNLTSPALQVPQLVKVTDGQGEYSFTDLAPGEYRLTYDLTGFTALVREGIRITTGFAARVDVNLKLASVAETVTVSGQSPLVDVTNTRGGATVSREILNTTPNSQSYYDVLLLAGGAVILKGPTVGKAGLGPVANHNVNYGQSVRMNNEIEGIKTMGGENPDIGDAEEVDVKTYGRSAEADIPGTLIQIVYPSGGNSFHGKFTTKAQHHNFQSNNVDAKLRSQGINAGDALVYFTEFSGDLGGRIVRDKLWFYGSGRNQRSRQTLAGYSRAPGPDNVYGTADDVPGEPFATNYGVIAKISYQATKKNRLIGFFGRSPISDNELGASRFSPYESTQQYLSIPRQAKIEWQGVLSDRWVVNSMFADGGYFAWYANRPGSTQPSRLNRETGYLTGTRYAQGGGSGGGADVLRTVWREQMSSSVMYHPEGSFLGSHEFQAGYRMLWGRLEFDAPHYLGKPPVPQLDNYQLVYDRVNGVPYQPVELRVTNLPVTGTSRYGDFGMYVSDQWRPTQRLTLNVGLRWQRAVGFVEAGEKVQGRFGSPASFPRLDVGNWNAVVPRLGAAFDLFGDGKTLAKASYGLYYDDFSRMGLAGQDFIHRYSLNSVTEAVYRWRDLDGNNDYTPGEVNLNLAGPDFVSILGATNNHVNPDLKQPFTSEVTGSLERELTTNVSVRALYVYKKETDQVALINTSRPFSVWNRQFTRRDPGPDGVIRTADDGGLVTFYDYDPAYRGTSFVTNMVVNSTDRRDFFHNLQISVNKRPGTGKWFVDSSFLLTKNHRWITVYAQTPNDNIFPLDETWDYNGTLAGGYAAPWGINASTVYQMYSGATGQRTYIFRTADPDGGPALPSSSTITVPLEAWGGERGPVRQVVNLRASRDFKFGAGRKIVVDVDAFNAFNSNTEWASTTYASGPSFGFITRIVQPRAWRFGLRVEF